MDFKIIKKMALLLFIFVSSGSFAQYKYDIGLRASTYDMERYQLEARFHLKSPYSIVANFSTGNEGNGDYWQSPLFNDSLINISQNYNEIKNNVLKVGVQRKLSFLATDVFYAGASIGVGMQQHRNGYSMITYSVSDSAWTNPSSIYEHLEEIESSENFTTWDAINAQLALSFGMDVPISKRFSINAEIGIAGIYAKSRMYSSSTFNMVGAVSGGLRYQFGKRE